MFSLAKKSKLNRFSKQRISLIKNLTLSLFKHGYIFTTKARASVVKSTSDRIITKAKKNDLFNNRKIISFFFQNKKNLNDVKKYLAFESVLQRQSGYTSLKKVGYRNGDKALVCCVRILT